MASAESGLLFPQVIARISLALLWVFMFNVNYGPVNGMLRKVGLGTYALNWLGSDKTALMSVILSWMFYIGFYMIIFMASISTIPESIYESTYLDGAGPIKQDLYITFPMLKSTIIMCSMLAITSSFQNIEYPYMMTGGGPGSSTTTLPLLMYKNMLDNRAGIANALGVILVVVGVLIVFTIKKVCQCKNRLISPVDYTNIRNEEGMDAKWNRNIEKNIVIGKLLLNVLKWMFLSLIFYYLHFACTLDIDFSL